MMTWQPDIISHWASGGPLRHTYDSGEALRTGVTARLSLRSLGAPSLQKEHEDYIVSLPYEYPPWNLVVAAACTQYCATWHV